jgi:hypothetical protein
MALPDELLTAWRRTHYTATTPAGTLVLHIGEPSAALDQLLDSHDCLDWAYLTACNPDSRMLSAEANRRRQQALESRLAREGLVFHRGTGIPDAEHDAHWPPEASVLVLDIDVDRAARLAWRYGQLAFVGGRRGGCPMLFSGNLPGLSPGCRLPAWC